jgi:N-acetylneuraminic acid mutarotase
MALAAALALLGVTVPALPGNSLARPLQPDDKVSQTPEGELNKKAWFNLMRSLSSPRNVTTAQGLEAPPAPVMWAVTGQYGNKSRNVQRYDPATNSWSSHATTFTHPIHNGGSAWMMGIWYIFGGEDLEGPTFKAEKYDPDTYRWYSIQPMTTKRTSLAASAVRGYLYAIGGLTCEDGVSNCQPLASVEKYNTLIDEWYPVSDMQMPRVGAVAGQLNKMLYVVGGYNGDPRDEVQDNLLSSVEKYNPETDSWSYVAPMRQARRFHGVALLADGGTRHAMAQPWKGRPNRLLVLGGEEIKSDGWRGALSSVESYDPVADAWTDFAPLTKSRSSPKVTALDGKIYVMGTNSSECYDPAADTWSSSAFPSHTVGKGKIVLFLATSGVLSPARRFAHQIATAEGRMDMLNAGDVDRYCMTTAAIQNWALDPRGGFVEKAANATAVVSYNDNSGTKYPTLGTCQTLSYYAHGPFVAPLSMMIDPFDLHYPKFDSFYLVPDYYQPLLTVLGEHIVQEMWPAHKIFVAAAAEAYALPDMEPLDVAPDTNLTFDDFAVVGYSTVGADPYYVLKPLDGDPNGFAVRVPTNASVSVGGISAVHYKQHVKNYEFRAKIKYTNWHTPSGIGSRLPNTGIMLNSKINFTNPNQISPWYTSCKAVVQPWGAILEMYYSRSVFEEMCMPDNPYYESLVTAFPNEFYLMYQALGYKMRVWVGATPDTMTLMTYKKEGRPKKKQQDGRIYLLDRASFGSPGFQIMGTDFEVSALRIKNISQFSDDDVRDFYG